jgi:hypothetical protein
MLKIGAEAEVAVINCLPSSRRKPHDQAVSKSVEQKPEIITGQILSGPHFNKPTATNLWLSEPLGQRCRDIRPSGPKATWSLPCGPSGATAKVFRDRGVRFACESTKLEPLRIRYFNILDRGGNLFELASGCSVRKTRPRYSSGAGSPQGVIDHFQ